jgi:hypothetical protein
MKWVDLKDLGMMFTDYYIYLFKAMNNIYDMDIQGKGIYTKGFRS